MDTSKARITVTAENDDLRAWREFVAGMEALIPAGDATIERLRAITVKAA